MASKVRGAALDCGCAKRGKGVSIFFDARSFLDEPVELELELLELRIRQPAADNGDGKDGGEEPAPEPAVASGVQAAMNSDWKAVEGKAGVYESIVTFDIAVSVACRPLFSVSDFVHGSCAPLGCLTIIAIDFI